jgi:hypothetical protein
LRGERRTFGGSGAAKYREDFVTRADYTSESFLAGLIGLGLGVFALSKGVWEMGLPLLAIGAGLIWLTIIAARVGSRAQPKPHSAPRRPAPEAKVNDLIIMESVDDAASSHWLGMVSAVDTHGRVAAVSDCRGVHRSFAGFQVVNAEVLPAAEVDVRHATRLELNRLDTGQQWASRQELMTHLFPAHEPLGDTDSP